MHATAVPSSPRGLALMLGWRRVTLTLTLSTLIALALSNHWERGPLVGLIRVVPLGFMAMLTFGLFEQWLPGIRGAACSNVREDPDRNALDRGLRDGK